MGREHYEMRFGGSGGQGMMLMGDVMAQAAGISEGREVVLLKSYGPEARGGACRSELIIDSGSTTASMIPQLGLQPGLVVMTNSLHVANALSELEHEPVLLMTGGTWDPHSESFQGQVAEQVLRSYDFDQLFIGADGIDLQRGTTTFNELLGLSRVMADVAREVIVMVESDKIGRKIPNLELPWSSVHTLITDDRLPLEAREQIQARGITLLCAALS